jgi:abortive infection bacteriophage resistance protein
MNEPEEIKVVLIGDSGVGKTSIISQFINHKFDPYCQISLNSEFSIKVIEYPEYHKSFLDDIEEEIRRNAKAPFVKNFRENYEGGNLPIYALVEVFSFGTLSKFYKNMVNQDKKIVAKSFGIGYTYLESWLESISYIRNICAHYGRLYNAKLSKTPSLYKEYTQEGYEGKSYSTVELDIEGYEMIEVKGNKSGKMNSGDNLVQYIYTKKLIGILPQTGEDYMNLFMDSMVFVTIAGVIIFIIVKRKKYKKENDKK